MEAKDRIIVDLCVNNVDEAISLVGKLSPHVGGFKIGFELMSAMLASAIAPAHEDGSSIRKIHRLFKLLGHSAFKVLWFIESKANGNGCAGIIFIPLMLVLVDKKGAQVSAITAIGDIIESCVAENYVVLGQKITRAPDPIKAVKEAAVEAESLADSLSWSV